MQSTTEGCPNPKEPQVASLAELFSHSNRRMQMYIVNAVARSFLFSSESTSSENTSRARSLGGFSQRERNGRNPSEV